MTEQPADEYRAELDFEISLADGGTLRGRDFRIDIDHAGVTEEVLAAALARELGLSAADQVDIHSRQVMRGRHRGSPAAVHRLPPPPDPEPALEPLPGPGRLPGMPRPGGGRATAHPPLPAAASWPPIPAVPADSWPPLPPVAGMLAGDDDVTSPIAKAGNGSGHPGAVLAPHDSGPADSAFRGLGSHDGDLQHGDLQHGAPQHRGLQHGARHHGAPHHGAPHHGDLRNGGLQDGGQIGPARPATPPASGIRLHRADLSHVIEDGMITYIGLPMAQVSPDAISAHTRTAYAPGVEFRIGEVTLCGSTGTYLASPAHRHADADDLSELPLDKLADLDAVLIDVSGNGQRAIDRGQLLRYDCRGRAVLIRTGWDRHWGTPEYFRGHPFLTADAATYLAGTGAVLVGADSLSIGDSGDPQRPVHTILLGAGIPVCEHLTNLDTLPASGFRFSAVPPRIRPLSTFPVRAFATWPDPD
ncbi:MAG TPA: cyclase family protein [Streptosporangiaceae bacterium]|jgi:kynurenine formamidase